MRLGSIPVADARGAILVHSTRAAGRMLSKGRVLDAADVAALAAAGIAEVVVASLDPGELGEDAAATEVARTLTGAGVRADLARTGRVNLRASAGGLLIIDRPTVDRANAVDEAITIATLPHARPVRAGEIVATIKIIPFGVAASAIATACGDQPVPVRVAPWRPARVGLVLTRFASTPSGILDRAAAAQRARLARLDLELARELRVAHDLGEVTGAIEALAAAGCDVILALGASAIMDRRDVIPAALERAGGGVTRLGMPVDPGNLAMLGTLGAATVIGLPGCARSVQRSGFDWMLEHVVAGVAIDPGAIAALGVGGLYDEAARPSPRDQPAAQPSGVAAIVLAAGKATRMGANKLLAELAGEPLVRHAVRAALGSPVQRTIVVTGNDADRVREALAGLQVEIIHNPEFATGMASSLRAGIAAIPDAAGALICLGDMPRVTAAHLATLITAFVAADDPGAIIVPTCERKRGNPVLWGCGRFAEIAELDGDVGARSLIERHASSVHPVPIDDPAILIDVDTPEALAQLR